MSAAERFFALFTRIRPGEGRGIALLGCGGFLLVCAYYILKTLRESLLLAEFDAETKSYAIATIAVVLFFLVPLYGVLFRHTNRTQLVVVINAFFVVNLLVFFLLRQGGISISFAYYVWIGIFGVMVVAQFWAYATDIYNVRSGQRIFPLLMIATTVGGLAGALLSASLVPVLGIDGLMALAGVLLLASVFFYRPARHAAPEDSRCIECEYAVPRFEGLFGGFAVVITSHYLRMIALFVVLLNWINSTGEYILADMVVHWADSVLEAGATALDREALIAAFYGGFTAMVSVVGLVIQTFLVARLLRHVGVPRSLLLLPVLSTLGYALIAFVPIFTIIRAVKVLENGVDTSLVSTLRQALFLPTSRETKYEGKTAIDTFFWRFGDLVQGLTIYVGINVYGFGVSQFAALNLVLGLLWIAVAVLIARQYCREVAANATSLPPVLNVPIPDATVDPGTPFEIALAPDTFVDPDPGDVITLYASLANGRPLPPWLAFEAQAMTFAGTAPANAKPLEVQVTARDFENLTASTTFHIRFS
ncbi:MAG: putative Ig domain-containing protein [Pseudomonadota bacterium]